MGQKGHDRYKENDDGSLDFTFSSLVLSDTVRYANLEDFVYRD